MARGRRYQGSSTSEKPADAAAGAPHVRHFMLKLFDREDGKAADWPLIAETLLREAFHAIDQAPDDPRTRALLRRAESGAYDRLTRERGRDPLPATAATAAPLALPSFDHDDTPGFPM